MAQNAKKPTPPKGLSDEARAEWDRVVKELVKRGSIAKSDRSILVLYVQAWDRNQRAHAALSSVGDTITYSHNGIKGLSHEFKSWLQTTSILRRLLSDLKLTPATRPREGNDEELEI